MRRFHWEAVVLGALLVGCGGEGRQAKSVDEYGVETGGDETGSDDMMDDEPKKKHKHADEEATEGEEKKKEGGEAPEPQFPENATVSQAIAAVPQGTERLNIEPDVLGQPLQDPKVYEPCKVGTQHFKIKVAVWEGKAVGIDVDVKNPKLADCIKQQIRGIEWQDKVKSLNTVEYAM